MPQFWSAVENNVWTSSPERYLDFDSRVAYLLEASEFLKQKQPVHSMYAKHRLEFVELGKNSLVSRNEQELGGLLLSFYRLLSGRHGWGQKEEHRPGWHGDIVEFHKKIIALRKKVMGLSAVEFSILCWSKSGLMWLQAEHEWSFT